LPRPPMALDTPRMSRSRPVLQLPPGARTPDIPGSPMDAWTPYVPASPSAAHTPSEQHRPYVGVPAMPSTPSTPPTSWRVPRTPRRRSSRSISAVFREPGPSMPTVQVHSPSPMLVEPHANRPGPYVAGMQRSHRYARSEDGTHEPVSRRGSFDYFDVRAPIRLACAMLLTHMLGSPTLTPRCPMSPRPPPRPLFPMSRACPRSSRP
jgi:hypothetical protein